MPSHHNVDNVANPDKLFLQCILPLPILRYFYDTETKQRKVNQNSHVACDIIASVLEGKNHNQLTVSQIQWITL